MSTLYPFSAKDAELWDTTPKVDASLQRSAGHITIPLDDSVSFEDPMDRRIDTDLKRLYYVSGAACRLAVSLTSVAAALKVWIAELEDKSSGQELISGNSSPLQSIKTAEAVVDSERHGSIRDSP